jgi:hypothetical protein
MDSILLIAVLRERLVDVGAIVDIHSSTDR